ncbi:MAG TPA: squalene/phytoene synthase family protein [Longimicrobiales bacterium]|nr:squalene/phytoene synthase family protein [Longimicrobiales bacterium]
MTPPAIVAASSGAPNVVLAPILEGLEAAVRPLLARGIPVPDLEGKLLRPLVAYGLVPPALRERLDERFWSGALAVQMVHEASLLHDDILDGAEERRGRPTLAARSGVGAALVRGDHLLTGAYRAAAASGSPEFLACFIEAVERTVAGEEAQARSAGRCLTEQEYVDVVAGKSGELVGAAAALGGAVLGLGDVADRVRLGRELGAVYQQVDDLLDYCPAADTGKPPLQDYRQRKWTWVLGVSGVTRFDLADAELMRALFAAAPGAHSAARRALELLRRRRDELLERAVELSPGDRVVADVLDGWLEVATRGVSAQEEALGLRELELTRGTPPSPEAQVAALAQSVGGPRAWPTYFGRHAKTFRFASRFFPREEASLIAGVYAFCRFTDDLVDAPGDAVPADVVEAWLEAWSQMARSAFEGHATGVPLLDVVMGEAGRRGVSWRYPDALMAGVGMDLTRSRYPDWGALEEYTFGVAGAVGGWVTQLLGIHDEALLARAHALGHGMQLTNIARDVGEDWARGRVYLPLELLREHGLAPADIGALAQARGPLPCSWRTMIEALLERAEERYDEAWPGIRALPGWYRRPVAVAAQAYRGIHAELRRSGYDNLRRRASTGASAKLILAASGLLKAHSRG